MAAEELTTDRVPLRSHGASPGPVRGIDVHAAIDAHGLLHLSWRLDAELPALRLPAPAAPVRADGLWRHSCFEAFIAAADSPGYCELNFSPSGQWAAWNFTGYRSGMRPLVLPAPPAARWRLGPAGLALDVAVRAADLLPGAEASRLRVALGAVIEEQSGTMGYWALRHPPGQPDFHHAEGFALGLDGAGPAVLRGADST